MPTTPDQAASLASGWVLVPCLDLSAAIAFFTERLGLRLLRISPADDPRVAEVRGRGLNLRLMRAQSAPPLRLVLPGSAPEGAPELRSPSGHVVTFEDSQAGTPLPVNLPELVCSRASDGDAWGIGRAGMQYRDLIPGRYGGRFIASHIRIPTGGPVPDHVHFHAIRFQMIHCVRGWVRLAYEDQGDSFVMRMGECVLQPPHIRHRVLESSDGLEVVEIACPAEHDTFLDHGLELPTGRELPARDFGGQRFVHPHRGAGDWCAAGSGLERRDLGLASATNQLASASLARPESGLAEGQIRWQPGGELAFGFVTRGAWSLALDDGLPQRMESGDSLALPAGQRAVWTSAASDAELLEVFVGDR